MKAFVMKKLDAVGFMDKAIPKSGPNDAVIKTTKAQELYLGLPYCARSDRSSRMRGCVGGPASRHRVCA